MEAMVLDKDYEPVRVVDVFTSFIWTDRYNTCGDFELYLPATNEMIEILKPGTYLWRRDSTKVMIVESVVLNTDPEEGHTLSASGRSLESILERRIIYGQQVLSGNFQNGIKTLLEQNVISPSVENRKIPNFTFRESSDPAVTSVEYEASYNCDNLYEAITTSCGEKNLGWEILPDFSNGGFIFQLFAGKDRSYAQDTLPWVVFSNKYDNLINSEFLTSTENLKNACLVGGEGEESEKDLVWVESGSDATGLERREIYMDSSDVSKTVRQEISYTDPDTGETIWREITYDNPNYISQLKQKGAEELDGYKTETAFTGEVEAVRQFVYGVDFFIGDVVQVSNEYGMETTSRITEIVRSQDDSGEVITPTFVDTNKKGE